MGGRQVVKGAEMLRKRLLGVAMAATVALTAAAFAGCGSDDSGGTTDADVLASIQILDKAGLHDIDVSINETKEVPATAQTTARHMETLLKLTKWPTDALDKEADTLAATLKELAAAVDAGDKSDLAKAGELAGKAHDQQHEFSGNVWTYLQKQAGTNPAGGDSH